MNATTLVVVLSIAVGIYLGVFDFVFSKLLSLIVG
jgi:preprotein translocase subunit SecE